MERALRTKINQAAHALAQREFARIQLELVALCEGLQKERKSGKDILQVLNSVLIASVRAQEQTQTHQPNSTNSTAR